MKLTRWLVLLAAFLWSVSLPGCGDNGLPLDFSQPPEQVGAIACLMKDGKPFIMVNMEPEAPRFNRLSRSQREHYLLKRSAEIVVDFALGKENYAGHPTFVVRLLQLDGKDDYNRPRWGSGQELAVLELQRDRVTACQRVTLSTCTRQELEQLFTSISFK